MIIIQKLSVWILFAANLAFVIYAFRSVKES